MSWLLLAVQLILSVVFLLAATGKVLRSEEFAAALRLSHLPPTLVAPLRAAVPVVELGLALALVLGTPESLPVALAITVVLLGAFTAWMIWVRSRRLRVRCGCFGTGSAEVGRRTIARNLLLTLLALLGLALAARATSPLPGPSLPMAVLVSSVGLIVALLLALRTALPSLAMKLDQLE